MFDRSFERSFERSAKAASGLHVFMMYPSFPAKQTAVIL